MIDPTKHLTDPREIRVHLRSCRHRYERVDGKPGHFTPAAALLGHAMSSAEAHGLSGEDAMTILAYHALMNYERAMDEILKCVALDSPAGFFAQAPANAIKVNDRAAESKAVLTPAIIESTDPPSRVELANHMRRMMGD